MECTIDGGLCVLANLVTHYILSKDNCIVFNALFEGPCLFFCKYGGTMKGCLQIRLSVILSVVAKENHTPYLI